MRPSDIGGTDPDVPTLNPCQLCGQPVSSHANVCPHCGQPTTAAPQPPATSQTPTQVTPPVSASVPEGAQAGSAPPPAQGYYPPAGYPTGAPATPTHTNGLAIVSLVLAILGFFLWIIGSIGAIITGHIALSQIKRSSPPQGGRGLAIAGLVIGYLFLIPGLLLLAIAIPVAVNQQSSADSAELESDLRNAAIAQESYWFVNDSYTTSVADLEAVGYSGGPVTIAKATTTSYYVQGTSGGDTYHYASETGLSEGSC